jgi:UDP-4-amino-4,6-dideoxy-N-acetyl-beta-L-altrosamine N-acetyltransferase
MDDLDELKGRLRPMESSDIKRVLEMRNHEDIRKFMFTQQQISLKEHTAWFDQCQQNPNLQLYVFDLEGVCSGFVQFSKCRFQGIFDWGFYTAPDAPKGTGKKLGNAALTHIFKQESIYKICGQALLGNITSIKFHKSLGFSQEGIFRDHFFDGQNYHDLVCFGLLQRDFLGAQYGTD